MEAVPKKGDLLDEFLPRTGQVTRSDCDLAHCLSGTRLALSTRHCRAVRREPTGATDRCGHFCGFREAFAIVFMRIPPVVLTDGTHKQGATAIGCRGRREIPNLVQLGQDRSGGLPPTWSSTIRSTRTAGRARAVGARARLQRVVLPFRRQVPALRNHSDCA